jgi:hypothetical protein
MCFKLKGINIISNNIIHIKCTKITSYVTFLAGGRTTRAGDSGRCRGRFDLDLFFPLAPTRKCDSPPWPNPCALDPLLPTQMGLHSKTHPKSPSAPTLVGLVGGRLLLQAKSDDRVDVRQVGIARADGGFFLPTATSSSRSDLAAESRPGEEAPSSLRHAVQPPCKESQCS